jgi:ATP-dependent Clp protease ATP-binding subunit ClpC
MSQLAELRQNQNGLGDGRYEDAIDLDRRWSWNGSWNELRTGWDRLRTSPGDAEDIAEVVSMWTGVPVMQHCR